VLAHLKPGLSLDSYSRYDNYYTLCDKHDKSTGSEVNFLRHIAKFWTSKNTLELQSTHENGTLEQKLGRKYLGRTSLTHIGKHNNEPILYLNPLLFR